MAAKTIREMLGVDETTALVSFANGERVRFTGIITINEIENIVTLVKKDYGNITINTDNINFISFTTQENEATEKKGKWLKTAYPHHVVCSECHKIYVTNEEIIEGKGGNRTYCTEAEYCPHCGVKMETEQGSK